MLCVIAVALVGDAMAKMVQKERNKDLVGTWASGAGNVLTGQNEKGEAFFNPMKRHFIVPKTAGYSYSFTLDGHFEMAKFTYNSDGAYCVVTTDACRQASGLL